MSNFTILQDKLSFLPVSFVKWCTNNDILAAVLIPKTSVIVYRVSDWQKILNISFNDLVVTSICFIDSNYLAIAINSGAIYLYTIENTNTATLYSICYYHNNSISYNAIKLLTLPNNNILSLQDIKPLLSSIIFPNISLFYTCDSSGTLAISLPLAKVLIASTNISLSKGSTIISLEVNEQLIFLLDSNYKCFIVDNKPIVDLSAEITLLNGIISYCESCFNSLQNVINELSSKLNEPLKKFRRRISILSGLLGDTSVQSALLQLLYTGVPSSGLLEFLKSYQSPCQVVNMFEGLYSSFSSIELLIDKTFYPNLSHLSYSFQYLNSISYKLSRLNLPSLDNIIKGSHMLILKTEAFISLFHKLKKRYNAFGSWILELSFQYSDNIRSDDQNIKRDCDFSVDQVAQFITYDLNTDCISQYFAEDGLSSNAIVSPQISLEGICDSYDNSSSIKIIFLRIKKYWDIYKTHPWKHISSLLKPIFCSPQIFELPDINLISSFSLSNNSCNISYCKNNIISVSNYSYSDNNIITKQSFFEIEELLEHNISFLLHYNDDTFFIISILNNCSYISSVSFEVLSNDSQHQVIKIDKQRKVNKNDITFVDLNRFRNIGAFVCNEKKRIIIYDLITDDENL